MKGGSFGFTPSQFMGIRTSKTGGVPVISGFECVGVNLGLSRNMEMLINCWISRRYVYNTVSDVFSLRSESVWRYFSRQRFGGVIDFLWSSVRLVQASPDHDTSTISYYHVLDLRSHTG